jgi:hypothetical protein
MMTSPGGPYTPHSTSEAFGNRLTLAEVRRALFRTTEGFFLLFGTLFGGIPLVIASVFTVVAARDAQLRREGEAAVGTVVAKHVSSDSDSTSYRVYYEFVAADGRTYGSDFSAGKREYYALNKGDRLDVRYSAADPFKVTVVDHGGIPLVWVLPFLSIFVVVGGTFFVLGGRRLKRRIKLYASGLQIWGKALGIREDDSMRVNDQPCRVLEFEYIDLMGRVHTCRSAFLSGKTIAALEGRATVPVVYTP